MKTFAFLTICILLLSTVVYASSVQVKVSESLEGDLISLLYDNSSNTVKFSTEFYNTGSTPYTVRARTDVFQGNDMISTGWSDQKDFMPGDKKLFNTYWYSKVSGNYRVRLRMYFGNEIKEYKTVEFSVNSIAEPKDVFSIKNLRTYDDYVLFDLTSLEDIENVIIIPSGYTKGWIFEQKSIEMLQANRTKTVMLRYVPTIWQPSSLNLTVASLDSSYALEDSSYLRKIEGLTGLYFFVTDSIKYALFK